MKIKKNKVILVFVISAILLFIYGSFITADIMTANSDNHYSKYIKYATILLCLFLTLIIGDDAHDKRDRTLLQIALVFHSIADFLVGILGTFEIALVPFFFMQCAYIIRHSRNFQWNRKEILTAIICYFLLGIILLFTYPLLVKADLLLPVSIYATALVTSLWMGIGTIWRKYYAKSVAWVIAIAMVLFFCCDVNVGLFNSTSEPGKIVFKRVMDIPATEIFNSPVSAENDTFLVVSYSIRAIIGILVWIFYLPAVFLLSISGFKKIFLSKVFPFFE